MYLGMLFTACAPVGGPNQLDHWWGMQIAGQPVGYYHETVRALPDGHLVTKTELKLVINRLGHKVEFDAAAESAETAEGELQSIHSLNRSSAQVVQLDATRQGANLEVVTETGGKSYVQNVPIIGTISGPDAFNRRLLQALKRPGDHLTGSLFVPELGKVTRETRTFLTEQKLSGKLVRKIEDEIEGIPGKQTLLMAADGTILERRQPFPVGELRLFLTDRVTAQAMSGGGTLPEELYDRTLVHANIRLPDPRSIDKIRLRITHKRPELGWPDLSGANQRVLERGADYQVIEVSRPKLSQQIVASAKVVGDGGESAEYRSPNALIQSDDPLVVQLARDVSGERTAYQSTRAMQDWVAAHMRLDLGIAIAPASEVAKNRRGTCLAYSILLCALERAAGLASRVVWGYVYEEGMWGGHAWTEVALDGRWVPIDAAMYSPGPADAARFGFAVSSLQNGPGNLTAAGLQLYGNISVKILAYTVNGRTVEVPDAAAPYRVLGDTYTNPWLRTALRKPHGWRFSTLNAIFPDPTVVAMEDGRGSVVKLQMESLRGDGAEIDQVFANAGLPQRRRELDCAGHRAYRVDTPTNAMIVLPVGRSAWILSAHGKNAPLLLERVAPGWSLH